MLNIFWMDVTPPKQAKITCPRCWSPLTSIHVPRWYWLMSFKRWRYAVACPCHHDLTLDNMDYIVKQAERIASEMEAER